MRKNILTFLLGAISGVIAYSLREPAYLVRFLGFASKIDLNEAIAIFLPGFIFGIFSFFFVWNFTKSYKKTIIWIVISGLSYIVAYWSGFGLSLLLDYLRNYLISFTIVYAVSGMLGTLILLTTFHFGIGKIPSMWFKIILI